jgi:cobaltochelatase CobN
MRLSVAITVLMLIALPVNAHTLQGDVQHTGNFTSSSKIIPKLEWKTYISGLVGSSPVVADGKVFVTNWYGWGSWQPGFYILDANTGRILWNNSTIYGASTPFVYGDKVIVGGMVYSGSGWNYYGYLYVINLTTKEVKSVELDDQPSYYGIASSPIVYDGYIYVLTHSNGTLWKLDLDGNVIESFTTGGLINPYTSPTAYDGKIFFAGNSSGDRIYCVYTNLTEVWNRSVDSQITDTPTIANVNGETLLIFTTKN